MSESNETYQILKVYSFDGEEFAGYVIHKVGTTKFAGDLWHEEEINDLRDQVTEMNNRAMLAQYWPTAQDEEVQNLINDPEFSPLEYHEVEDIADYEELGEQVQRGEVRLVLNEETGEHSIHEADRFKVQTTKKQELKDPSQPMRRFHDACQVVAQDRLEAARGTV